MSLAKMSYTALGFAIVVGLEFVLCQLCSRPSTTKIENGAIKPKCSKKGGCSLLTIKCSSCAKRVGPEKIKCVGGEWAAMNSSCITTSCGPLQLAANIIASSDSTHCGAVIKLKCADGYEPSKITKMVCKSTGKWKGKRLKCTKINNRCADLAVPKNARVLTGRLADNNVGDYTVFECKESYKAIGRKKIRCLKGGRWSDPLVECKAGGKCPDIFPGDTPGLQVLMGKPSNNVYEDKVSFACEPGFVLMGHPRITCMFESVWTQTTPICIKTSSTQCPMLSVPDNGFITNGKVSNNTIGDTVTFACDPGYTLDGTHTLTCINRYTYDLPGDDTDGLVWDITMPVCRLSDTGDCPDLVLPKYGYLVGAGRLTGNKVGDRIVGSCRKPYLKQGKRVLECLPDGNWDTAMFKCFEIDVSCPTVTLDTNSKLVVLRGQLSGNIFYDRIIFGCQSGYAILEDIYYMLCNRTGGWTQQIPVCTESGCKSSETLLEHGTVNGTVESGRYSNWAKLRYECDECYQLIGADIRTCQNTGVWSPLHPPSCTFRTCNGIRSLQHGSIFPNKETVACGSSVTIQCNRGYVIKGENRRSKEIHCETDGWNPRVTPICMLNATCEDPPKEITNGNVFITSSGGPLRIGENVTFMCNECYKLEGNDKMTCLESQNWSSDVPRCVPRTCEDINSDWISVMPNNPLVQHEPSDTLYKLITSDYSCNYKISCMEPVFPMCGLPSIKPTTSGRIVKGVEANSHSWPWAAALFWNFSQLCGGSLIHPQWVLSAAHCVVSPKFNGNRFIGIHNFTDIPKWQIKLGKHKLSKLEQGEITTDVSKIVLHPEYVPRNYRYDFSLFKLEKPVAFTRNIIPVCVPSVNYFSEIIDDARDEETAWELQSSKDMNCTAIGWGLDETGNKSDALLQVALPIIPNKVCKSLKQRSPFLHESGFCAGGTQKDTCGGDSGGAYMCRVGSRWMLAGLTSHGPTRCGTKDVPGVYARVTPSTYKWITDTIAADNM
ncbi:unnamed protein product [Owenia fusiformis]|uniref:Uncharacterized protein n=1 Tax=Owenia fusiformis TaxID=6347 RepID=A0A8S4Q345_OWEFU|nr:unnamed protein product [Owenia fusiformis]